MNEDKKKDILIKVQKWFKDELALAHKNNTLKLTSLEEFNINPFLWVYLANYLEGNSSAEALARAIIYPRVLGTSINTSFGQRTQEFITRIFTDTYGSVVPGIDIEFIDAIDKRKKYCQVKAGPNVINNDDVTTIKNHFRAAINLARTNHLEIEHDDFVFCILYGEQEEKSTFVKAVEDDYKVFIGKEFWLHFTGDNGFYTDLIKAIGEVANDIDMKETIESVVSSLSKEIRQNYPDLIQ